jgi:pyruvate-formate lyase-activating enzyme
MWFILDTQKRCFTGDWNDDSKAVWSDELSNAFLFESKIEALQYETDAIKADQAWDPPRYPDFVGCRVVNLVTYVAELLSRKGLDVTPDHDAECIYLNVESKDLKELSRTLPRSMGIVPFKLRTKHNHRVHPWPELTATPET